MYVKLSDKICNNNILNAFKILGKTTMIVQ